MIDAGLIKILITLAVGALIGAAVNHYFAGQRWKAELRNSEVSYWRDFADRLSDVQMKAAKLTKPVAVAVLPQDEKAWKAWVAQNAREVQQLQELTDSLRKMGTRRAPEPLNGHVRLFIKRMDRAEEAIPYDTGLAGAAVDEFRSALDEYVRRGKTRRAQQPPEAAEVDPGHPNPS